MTPTQIIQRLNSVLVDQSIRNEMLANYFYMYGHSTLYGPNSSVYNAGRNAPKLNIVQSCVDTLVNKISKNQPRATFLTDNGDWGMKKKAEQREKFVYGQFFKSDAYKKGPFVLLQALVYGDGFFKVYNDEKEIKIENVLTLEMVFDDKDALYGKPQQCWQIKYVSKETLQAAYPNHKEDITNVQTTNMPFYMSGVVQTDMVTVVEYWKLPNKKVGKEWKGGFHSIVCGDVELMKEEWDAPFFPFAHIGYVKNLVGFWSKGVTEVIYDQQIEVNRTLKRISDALRLVASPKVLYEYNSKIVQSHFNNDVGAMLGYLGTPPQFIMPQAVGPELFKYLEDTIQRAYAEVGISQLSAASQKPAGLNSGKALREYNDLETERFAALAKNYENMYVDLAELVLWQAKKIQQQYGKYSVLAPDSRGCEIINFKDIDMDQDSYVIQVYPTSMLPKTPAGRLEYVQEMLGAGLITPEEGLELLDFPDTQKITKLKTSELDDILTIIDLMLDTDQYMPPEPYQNLSLGVKYMNKAYLYYKNQKCPEEKLELLIRWMNDAIMMLESQNEQAQEPIMNSQDINVAEADAPIAQDEMEAQMIAEQQVAEQPMI